MDGWNFIVVLILMTSYTQISGLCSTCIEERCHDNGECIIGCKPGYVGAYCDEACPSRCLNKACHLNRIDGTVTCTDGCGLGNCGVQCFEPCPGDCLTCDRQCGSCNVTLCPERRYGADCSDICSPRYGKCDRETGQCIICRRGYYGDECNQKCRTCFTRAKSIMDTCLSGCDICQTKETCPTGFHGDSCGHKCLPGCETPRGCNRATGECSTECVSGYHGLNCNYTCSEHCLSGRCNRATGECSTGCVSGYHGLNCNYTCSEHCLSGRCNRATGECSTGCVSGYHGLNCNYTCSEHCLSGRCNRATGECSTGCVFGYHGLTCNYTCSKLCGGGYCNQQNGFCTSGCVNGYTLNLGTCIINNNEETDDDWFSAFVVTLFCFQIFLAAVLIGLIYRRLKLRPNTPRRDYEAVPLFGAEPSRAEQFTARTKEEIAIMTTGMVRVSAVDVVLDKLKKGERWVTITGNAGDGKTTLGYLVLKEFLQKNDNVFTVENPEEYHQIANLRGSKLLMFDDRFGRFLADQQLIKSWLDVIRKLLSFNENDKLRPSVIFVSRKSVVNESRMYLGRFTDRIFHPNCIVDLSEIQVTEERKNILDHHLQHERVTVSDELKRSVSNKVIAHGFPHCCKMHSKLRSNGYDVDIEEFFESPLRFLDMTTKVLYKNNCKDLFQLMVKNDGQFDVYMVEDEDKRHELLQVEKEQEGSYITVWKNGICQFAHPSVYESVLNVINNIDPLFCVQYATLSVIRQKMIISTSDEEDKHRSPCYIIVKPIPSVLKALAERFREEILKGDYSVFRHRLCESGEFCEALISCCIHNDENEEDLNRQYINEPGDDGETMLWTALRSGSMIAAQALVRGEAYLNIADTTGRAPLHALCQLTNSTGAAYDDQPRFDFNTIRVIITEGRGDANIRDHNGQTPLHYLCQLNTFSAEDDYDENAAVMRTIRLVITEGRGDVNICDQYGQTPLHFLLKWQTLTKEDIQWILTEGKGDLNQIEQNMSTPLHYLCSYLDLQLDIVDLVIRKGHGDFNKGDEHGTTPFHNLCQAEKVELGVVNRIVKTAKADINKQDGNGITPLHVLCRGSLRIEDVLTLINEGDKADRYGNTPLHFLCRRREINADWLQQHLHQVHAIDMKKQNALGYTPLDYLNDQDDRLPWTDGMIDRSAADLVVCTHQQGDQLTVVLGPAITLRSEIKQELQVVNFGRELTNIPRIGDENRLDLINVFTSTCSPILLPTSSALLSTLSYWETIFRLRWKKEGFIPLLAMGVVEGSGNLEKLNGDSIPPGSLSVSVWRCPRHPDRLCVRVLKVDQERTPHGIGECISLPPPQLGDVFTFKFGLLLDAEGVAFIDVKRGELLCKVHLQSTQIFPMFCINQNNDFCDTRLTLVSGREISVPDKKIQLIQKALTIEHMELSALSAGQSQGYYVLMSDQLFLGT